MSESGASPPPSPTPPRRAARPSWRVVSRAVVLIALLVVIAAVIRSELDVEWSAESVRDLVRSVGWWGPAVFVALLAFRLVVLIPSAVLLTAAGACFGFAAGTLYGGVGLLIGALLNFGAAHWAGRDRLLAQLPPRTRERLALADSSLGVGVVALATAYPISPITAIQLGAILAGIHLLPYGAAVFAGALVRAATYSLFGDALVGGEGLWVATGILAAVTGLPLLVPRVRTWVLQQLRRR